MPSKLTYLLFLIFIIAFISGCKSSKKISSNEKTHPKTEADDTQEVISNTSLFIDAKKEQLLGNEKDALKLFRKLLENNPQHAAAHYETARLLLLLNKADEALPHIEKAASIDEKNKWYQLKLGEVYQKTGNYSNATKLYGKLVRKNPHETLYYYKWAIAYMYEDKYKNAIEVYNKLEEEEGISEKIILQKHKLYIHLNKEEKAAQELNKLISAFPYEPGYYSILGEYYLNNGMEEKAFDIYQKLGEIDPDNAFIQVGMANYYKKKGDQDAFFQSLKLAFNNPKLDIDTKVQILLSYYSVTENFVGLKAEAFELIDILLKIHPANAKAYSIQGDFLSRDKKTAEARAAFYKVLSLDSSKYVIWEQLMRLEFELENYETLYTLSNNAIELYPNQSIPYLFNGVACMKLEKIELAVNRLKMGASLVYDDRNLHAQFYMYMGESYHLLGDHENSDLAFEKALSIDPDNAQVMNNYSFYLAEREEKLEKAETMARLAIDIRPNTAVYEDTYGWVLYKLGYYAESEKWLRKAINNGGNQDADVLEHYGDLMYKTGNTNAAVEYWEKALQLRMNEKLEQKIKQRKIVD